MNHEKEYSKTAAPGCEVHHIKALSSEGHFLPESALKKLSKVPHRLMIVADCGEKSVIKAVQVAVGKAGRRYVADKITGTLYDPETGRSMLGGRMLEGPAPEGYEPPPREAYNFGTQPIRAHKPGTTNIFVMTAEQAAKRYGIHEKTVSDIRRRRSWGHVA